MRAVERQQPAVFIFENVKGIATKSSDGSPNLDAIVKWANSIGYIVCAHVLSAPDYGCPSRRDRYYIVGVKTSVHEQEDQLAKGFTEPKWMIGLSRMLDSLKGVEGAAGLLHLVCWGIFPCR